MAPIPSLDAPLLPPPPPLIPPAAAEGAVSTPTVGLSDTCSLPDRPPLSPEDEAAVFAINPQPPFFVPSVERLPTNVRDFLDNHGLEAFGVPMDGNCLYHAIHHGCHLDPVSYLRGGTAAITEAACQPPAYDEACRPNPEQ